MQPIYSEEAEAYREKIRDFISNNLPANWQGIGSLTGNAKAEFLNEWRRILSDNQLLATMWPWARASHEFLGHQDGGHR